MANLMDNENDAKARKGIKIISDMIDISTSRLEGLRTHCNSSAELTQQEIRTLETKLVKLYSELLIAKSKLPEQLTEKHQKEIMDWLRVVGLSEKSLNAVIQRVNSLEMLLDKTDGELRVILNHNAEVQDEEIRRLTSAMRCLKICQSSVKKGTKEQNELFWDSWNQKTSLSTRIVNKTTTRTHRNLETQQQQNEQTHSHVESLSPEQAHVICTDTQHTLTPSPPNSPSTNFSNKTKTKGFITTPPPRKKHQTLVSTSVINTPLHSSLVSTSPCNNNSTPIISKSNGQSYDQNSLTKSKSHEFQYYKQQLLQQEDSHQQLTSCNSHQPEMVFCASTLQSTGTSSSNTDHSVTSVSGAYNLPKPRSRLHTEPTDHDNTTDLGNYITSNLAVPRSPCTPIITRGMGHTIQHRFTKKFKIFQMTSRPCDLCSKQMYSGFKCTECKYRCHKDCMPNVPPSCGLPQELVEEFRKKLNDSGMMPNTSPSFARTLMPKCKREKPKIQTHNIQIAHGPESNSPTSSCNSSSPSSPALAGRTLQTPAALNRSQFNFPDVSGITNNSLPSLVTKNTPCNIPAIEINENLKESDSIKATTHAKQNLLELTETNQSNDSDKTMSLTGSTSTSTDSDRTPVRLDSMEERDPVHWPRQNSLSLKEWDIPFDDLKLLDIIGNGRFGTVHRGLWHGDVAVKILKENYLNDERTLEAFKLEVATFKKTRHENLVLFMGACMQPPRLAIITSFCKGNTLYTLIHLRKDKFNLNRTTLVAQQISQGMGYLHARGIVHKDLKTKNIFLENGKVIITDFGLFSATKLQYTEHGLGVARNWLCYLAPELIRGLKPNRPADEKDLSFTKASDVYAFGTVWYELLCGEFPFKEQPHESVIWQVGRGMKQPLANLQAARDVKDILMLCWAYDPESRPDFSKLLTNLERLPKKRLARSPSHPIQLSRSAESVF